MRQPLDAARLRAVLERLAESRQGTGRIYLVGGATALMHGWRDSTIDLDLRLTPESEPILKAIPAIKESLQVNIELAAPDQFIPALPGWESRSLYIDRIGDLSFFHYDPYAQVLAKIERGHARDVQDVRAFIASGLVDPDKALALFSEIEPELYRFPAIDPRAFRQRIERMLSRHAS